LTCTVDQEFDIPKVLANTPKNAAGTLSVTVTLRNAGRPLEVFVIAPLGKLEGATMEVLHDTPLLVVLLYPLSFA
jgi:hypothetical protein